MTKPLSLVLVIKTLGKGFEMAITCYITNNGTKIEIDDTQNLARAGREGTAFAINSPKKYRNYCAKIYLEEIRNDQKSISFRRQKIEYMVERPIINNDPETRICSPTEMLFDNQGQFVGFIMLKAFDGSDSLTWLTSGYRLAKKPSVEFKGFDGSAQLKAVYNRLVVSYNIARAVSILHDTGRYVIGDMKPQNMLIAPDGKVSLIDMDSMQIADSSGKVLFRCPVFDPHYKPPEGHDGRVIQNTHKIEKNWDSFSFGVIAYQLIIGSHPYTGIYSAPYDKGTDIEYNVANGLFLHGKKSSYLNQKNISTLQPIFDRWNGIPRSLRAVFLKAFETGQSHPGKRPTMNEWGRSLSDAIQQINLVLNKKKPSSGSVFSSFYSSKKSSGITAPKPLPPKPPPVAPAPVAPAPTPDDDNWLGSVIFYGIIAVIAYFVFFNDSDNKSSSEDHSYTDSAQTAEENETTQAKEKPMVYSDCKGLVWEDAYTVKSEGLNVRSSLDSLDDKYILGAMQKYELVCPTDSGYFDIGDESLPWIQTKLTNGEYGWLSKKYLHKVECRYVGATKLRVRATAGLQAAEVGYLYRGDKVCSLGVSSAPGGTPSDKDWYYVSKKNKNMGWVSSAYLLKHDVDLTQNLSESDPLADLRGRIERYNSEY